jgi:hypothetical protein
MTTTGFGFAKKSSSVYAAPDARSTPNAAITTATNIIVRIRPR